MSFTIRVHVLSEVYIKSQNLKYTHTHTHTNTQCYMAFRVNLEIMAFASLVSFFLRIIDYYTIVSQNNYNNICARVLRPTRTYNHRCFIRNSKRPSNPVKDSYNKHRSSTISI